MQHLTNALDYLLAMRYYNGPAVVLVRANATVQGGLWQRLPVEVGPILVISKSFQINPGAFLKYFQAIPESLQNNLPYHTILYHKKVHGPGCSSGRSFGMDLGVVGSSSTWSLYYLQRLVETTSNISHE